MISLLIGVGAFLLAMIASASRVPYNVWEVGAGKGHDYEAR
jgi:hypothetical protein